MKTCYAILLNYVSTESTTGTDQEQQTPELGTLENTDG